jgi:trehalose 6-phosphate synthase/phosphatase
MPTRLINVANRLPVIVGQTIKKSPGGLVAALERLQSDDFALEWIGWPGAEVEPARQAEVERILRDDYHAAPIFLTAEQERGFYEGFSNSSIWPLLHYMPSKFRYETAWWEHYRAVNVAFCDKICAVARDGDLVWVHDYQLMLLPTLLRLRMPGLRIGFFLHTPFPSYEVFRCNPKREDLVSGLLGADLVGFHTFGYLRHFRSSALRLLGIDSEPMRIRHEGHTTRLGVFPIGINAQKFEEDLGREEVRNSIEQFRRNFQNKRIVLSVERLDYTKGILHRLDAIDEFLAHHEDERDKLKFIFVSVPSREGVQEYQVLRDDVEARIGHINGRYTTLTNAPVHFIHGSVSSSELTALYALADVGLVTPLIDGMNLVAKEFVACQRDEAGVLILSEFAGAAEELFSAIIVNPYDTSAVARALAVALAMPPEERAARMNAMRQRVMRMDAQTWAGGFVRELAAAPTPRAGDHDATGSAAEAFERLRDAIRDARRVALFLDYDGTLREIERDPAAAGPNVPVLELLDKLARVSGRANLDVTIISGRTPQDLESFVGRFGVGMIAEHGAFLRRPGAHEWEQLDRNASYSWMDEILKILKPYVDSTPGSFIESKRTSLVWHYRRADPEFGQWKANQLAEELAAVTASAPIHVRPGRKIVEVTASDINKGAAVLHALADRTYDLIGCAGDDTTDESMFQLDLRNLLSIKIGDQDSRAQYRLPSPAAFRRFLQAAIA